MEECIGSDWAEGTGLHTMPHEVSFFTGLWEAASHRMQTGLAEVASPDCRLCDPGLLDYVLDQLDQNRKRGL